MNSRRLIRSPHRPDVQVPARGRMLSSLTLDGACEGSQNETAIPPLVFRISTVAVKHSAPASGPRHLLGTMGGRPLLRRTPTAMVVAQATLGTPIVVALVHRMMVDVWAEYGDALLVDGASVYER